MGSDLKHRLGGLACLAGGAGFGWWGIWLPYQAARAHDPQVEYQMKIFILVPMLLVFGIFFVIFGSRISYRNAQEQRLTTAGWILMAIVTITSGLSIWWFDSLFKTLGYRSGF
jgi:hypothetical protein